MPQKRTGPDLPPAKYGKGDKAHSEALCKYQESYLQYEHAYWIRRASRMRMADLYYQAIQWLQKSFNIDPTQTPWWSPLSFKDNDPDAIPTPVFDEFSPPIENEAARLGKPEYEPYARTDIGADVKAREDAERAQKILNDGLEATNFRDKMETFYHHMPLYGGAFLLSRWDQSWEDTTRIPSLDAVRCPACDFKLRSSKLTEQEALGSIEQGKAAGIDVAFPEDEEMPPSYSVSTCLTCQDHEEQTFQPGDPLLGTEGGMMPTRVPGGPKLEPFTPIDDELYETDHFGRDLGDDVPKGQWAVDVPSQYGLHVENMGIDVQGDNIRAFTYEHVESLDWVNLRYRNGYMVQPEEDQVVGQYHPIVGERVIFFSGTTSPNGGSVFRQHARVRETYVKPFMEYEKGEDGEVILDAEGRPKMRLNKGRAIVSANRVILFDGDLMIESSHVPGKQIPRVLLRYVPFGIRSGGREMYGVSMAERIFDVCDNVNEMQSQVQDARQTMGSPKWLAERGHALDYNSGDRAGIIWQYTWQPDAPAPREIGNTLLNSEWTKEYESNLDHLQRNTNMQAVEQGNVPPGVAAALAIQMLTEQTAERRRGRIQRIRRTLEAVFSHGLDLMEEFVREEREFNVEAEPGQWESGKWTGEMLTGSTEVHIKAEPEHDTELQRQQTIRDLIEAGVIDPRDPAVKRILAEELGAHTALFKAQELQLDNAEREFLDLKGRKIYPVVDEDLDDHVAHYEQHGQDCLSEWWLEKEKAAGWNKVLMYLAGWKSPKPTGQIDTMTGQPITMSAFDATAMNPLAPKAVEGQILQTWAMLLQMVGYQPLPDEVEPLSCVMQFRAHHAAHKILAEQAMAAANMGAATMAAPAAMNETAAGTVATAAQGPTSAPA